MNDTIHTALFDIAKDGDDAICLGNGITLVRPNENLKSHNWSYVQGDWDIEEESKASRYIVCEYPQYVVGQTSEETLQQASDRFYSGLMALQVIKPIRTNGFIYRRQQIERRTPMHPGTWAMKNKFDDAMLARVPTMIDRLYAAMIGADIGKKNAITLLQLGLEHFHHYISGLLWVTGMEAIFDSGGREEFKKELCNCLGAHAPAFPNWNQLPNAPSLTVEQLAIPLFVLRNKLAHGADLRSATFDPKHPVDLTQPVSIMAGTEQEPYAIVLCEAACYLLCQVLQCVL